MVYQFYTVEIKQNQAGEYEHDVQWHWDENADVAQRKGESKFFEIMSRAAVSEYTSHGAILFSAEGFPLKNDCYKHVATTASEEPDPEKG